MVREGQAPVAETVFVVISAANRDRRLADGLQEAIGKRAIEMGLLGVYFDIATSHHVS